VFPNTVTEKQKRKKEKALGIDAVAVVVFRVQGKLI